MAKCLKVTLPHTVITHKCDLNFKTTRIQMENRYLTLLLRSRKDNQQTKKTSMMKTYASIIILSAWSMIVRGLEQLMRKKSKKVPSLWLIRVTQARIALGWETTSPVIATKTKIVSDNKIHLLVRSLWCAYQTHYHTIPVMTLLELAQLWSLQTTLSWVRPTSR